MDSFIQSPAGDFHESPGRERGALAPCLKVGWDVATITVDNSGTVITPVPKPFQNAGAGYWGVSGGQGVSGHHSAIPRADRFRLEVDFYVNTPPASFGVLPPEIYFQLLVWPGWSPEIYAVGNFGPARYYRPAAGEYFDESGPQFHPFSDFHNPNLPINYTFAFPWTEGGQHRLVKYLTGFENCYRFFELRIPQASYDTFGGGEVSGGFPPEHNKGDWGGTFRLFRIQRMIVKYITSLLTATVGQSIQFTDITIADNRKLEWLWNFGDGTTSALPNPTKSYAAPGNYTVTLTITDSSGLSYTTDALEQKVIRVV